MPTVIRNDPYPGHNFHLIVNGVTDEGDAVSCAFTEITGLETELHVIEYRNGNEDHTVRKVPGLKSHTNLVCKKGSTGHHQFWDWIKQALDGDVQRARRRRDPARREPAGRDALELLAWRGRASTPVRRSTRPTTRSRWSPSSSASNQ